MIKNINLIRDRLIVGTARLEITDKTAFLSKVQIYKKFRGNGYCNFLIKKVVNLAKRMNMNKIQLHVKHDNIKAIKCYTDNNFIIIQKNYDKKKLFGYTMELLLS